MRHHMKLQQEPFDQIRAGNKTIELRLYDKKRQLVKVGDEIEFICLDENRPPLSVQVIALHRFDSFAALYAALPLLQCGYDKDSLPFASPKDMDAYYTPEEQEKYGVVGIEVRRLGEKDSAPSTKSVAPHKMNDGFAAADNAEPTYPPLIFDLHFVQTDDGDWKALVDHRVVELLGNDIALMSGRYGKPSDTAWTVLSEQKWTTFLHEMERLAADERTREKYLKLRIVFAFCVTCNLREDTLYVSEAAAEKMDILEKARLIFSEKGCLIEML